MNILLTKFCFVIMFFLVKEVLICHVTTPDDISSPTCLVNVKIKEIVLRRWTASIEEEGNE